MSIDLKRGKEGRERSGVLVGWMKPALKMQELRPSKKETQRREIGVLMLFPVWVKKNPRRLGFSLAGAARAGLAWPGPAAGYSCPLVQSTARSCEFLHATPSRQHPSQHQQHKHSNTTSSVPGVRTVVVESGQVELGMS